MKTIETLSSEIKEIKRQIKTLANISVDTERLAFNQETEKDSAELYDASNLIDKATQKLKDQLENKVNEYNFAVAYETARKAMTENGKSRIVAIAYVAEVFGLADEQIIRLMNEIK